MSTTALTILDNVVRAGLVLATAVSFYPQAHKIISLRNSDGISLVYLGLIAISAMEQDTLFSGDFLFRGADEHRGGVLADRTVGDWLDCAQVVVFLLGSLFMFFLAVFHAPRRLVESVPTTVLLLGFVSISVFATLPSWIALKDHAYPPSLGLDRDIFFGVHCVYVSPVVAVAVIAGALEAQWLAIRYRGVPETLSDVGLRSQGVLGLLVGLSWIWRMSPSNTRYSWWWLTVHSCFCGVVQGTLAGYVAYRRWATRVRAEGVVVDGSAQDLDADESTALLSSSN